MTADEMEKALEKLWRFRVVPTNVVVTHDLLEKFARKRPGGGNSHQRRVWYRQWSPTRFAKKKS